MKYLIYVHINRSKLSKHLLSLQTVRKPITILVRRRMSKNRHGHVCLTVSQTVANVASQMARLTVRGSRHGSMTTCESPKPSRPASSWQRKSVMGAVPPSRDHGVSYVRPLIKVSGEWLTCQSCRVMSSDTWKISICHMGQLFSQLFANRRRSRGNFVLSLSTTHYKKSWHGRQIQNRALVADARSPTIFPLSVVHVKKKNSRFWGHLTRCKRGKRTTRKKGT
jgi:hypothetical protein